MVRGGIVSDINSTYIQQSSKLGLADTSEINIRK